MSRMHIPLSVLIAPGDLAAYQAELFNIFERYGVEAEDCQPHLRAARESALARAASTFSACIDFAPANAPATK